MKSVSTLLREAWHVFASKPQAFVVLALPLIALDIASTYLSENEALLSHLFAYGTGIGVGVSILLIGALIMVTCVCTALITYAFSDVQNALSAVHVRNALNRILSLVWTTILATFLIALGFIAFIVPGFIAMFACKFVLCVILFEEERGWSAIKKSYGYVKISWSDAIAKTMFYIALLIIGSMVSSLFSDFFPNIMSKTISMSILNTLVTVLMTGYLYFMYREFRRVKESQETVMVSPKQVPQPSGESK